MDHQIEAFRLRFKASPQEKELQRVGDIVEEMSQPDAEGKNQAAVELGRKGGAARAASLTAEQRAEIARKAAAKRWDKSQA